MKTILTTLLTSLILTFPTFAETWQGRGSATYSVKATGHTVHGTVDLEPFEVALTKTGEDTLLSFDAEVATLKMDTDKKKRDEEMQHHLHATEHPMISGAASDLSLKALSAEPEEPITLPFTFHMIGIDVEKEASLTAFEQTKESIAFTVTFNVSQIEHGLKLIKMMGFLKVKDDVSVEVQFEMAPAFEEDAPTPNP